MTTAGIALLATSAYEAGGFGDSTIGIEGTALSLFLQAPSETEMTMRASIQVILVLRLELAKKSFLEYISFFFLALLTQVVIYDLES